MPYISREDLIQGYPNIMPETVNLIRWFYDNFDNRSAANRNIVNVEPLYFIGASAGSEFLTYAATKLYLCFNLIFTGAGSGLAAAGNYTLYDSANAVTVAINNNYPYWDATAAQVRYNALSKEVNNVYFSRLTLVNYSQLIFNGYRITLA